MVDRKRCASLALATALALTAPALAQQAVEPGHHPGGAMMNAGGMPSGMMSMMRGDEGMGAMGMGGMRMMAAMTGHVEGRLAFLKAELKITDAQLPQWDKFADAVRVNSKAMEAMMPGGTAGTAGSATLPDRLAMREKMMAAHLDALRKLTNAVTPLYAAFSVEQKKTADDLIAPMGMMR